MAEIPDLPVANGLSAEQEMAAALDAVLDAVQAGRPIDRAAVLARHPGLAGALQALEGLVPGPPPDEPANLPVARPERIGPYCIERELGAGGFGVVYLAYDPDVKRRVAIKVLHPGRLDQPEAITRFHREAHLTGKLHHPGIVKLYEYSRQGPPYFLVTEYVEGTDPRVWCRERRCSPQEIAGLVARIADAVGYAHLQQVWHRDLKPGNILVDAAGEPHVLDFGLARLESAEGLTVTAPTADGHVLGSLPYMPPEQASGHSHTADARSDTYSLGVILYELLTGQLPFQGPAHSLPARVAEEAAPPLRRFNPALSRDLEAVCMKALARRPQDRYASAAALAEDLRAYAAGQPVAARRLTWIGYVFRTLDRRHFETMRQGWTVLLLLLGVVILVGCVVCNYWQMKLMSHSPRMAWLAILLTKVVQVGVMLYFVYRLRPIQPSGPVPASSSGSRPDSPPSGGTTFLQTPMTAAERQIWSLVPGYYGSLLTLVTLNWFFLKEPIPLAPVLAVLSGMGFATLGATIWGWFYVWGAAFFLLAVLIVLWPVYGLTLLGLGWFVCLVVGSVHLHWTR